jgi:hypothetical protein
MRRVLGVVALVLLCASACGAPGSAPVTPAKPAVAATPSQPPAVTTPPAARRDEATIWRPVGSWSGRGNIQTESFRSDSGDMRVRWQTSHESTPGTGVFHAVVHSAISGRPLQTAVDERGVGQGTDYIGEDPREFFIVVESSNLEWAFTVEEAIPATASGTPRK